jgi:hypothetical protein
LLLVELG